MKRTLIVLLGAVLILALILLKKNHDEKKSDGDSFAIDSILKTTVTNIKVIKNNDSVDLQKKDALWRVSKGNFPVDTARLTKVFTGIFGLQSKEVVSRNPERYSEYGLDSIEAKKVIFQKESGENIAEVFIGKTSGSDYSSTYWRWAAKPEVYRSPGNFSSEIVTKANEWKQRKILALNQSDLKTIEVNWHDSLGSLVHFKLSATSDTSWKMLEPQDSNRVKNMVASEIARSITDLTIDQFVEANDTNLSALKLDSPWVFVKITTKSGVNNEIKFSRDFGGHMDEHSSSKVMLGAMNYVQHPTEKEIVQVANWRVKALQKRPFELLDASIVPDSTGKKDLNPAGSNGKK